MDVPPVYPAIARAAKVSGIVIIEATIAKDGSVKDLNVLRHGPLVALDQAAMDAVRQWKYTPRPCLSGQPVEVVMSVTVIFTLK